MRGLYLSLVLGLGLLACGPAKPPADASNANDESAPKWDSSSETTSNPPSHASSESSGSSSSSSDDSSASTSGSGGSGGSAGSSGSSGAGGSSPSGGDSSSAGSGGGASTASAPAAGGGGQHLPPDFGGKTYPRDQTETVLKRAARQVKNNCGAATDENGKAGGPWGHGTITITLGHNGHSKGVSIAAPFDGKPTGRCAQQAFKSLIYPPSPGPDADVAWDVELVKPQ